MTEQLLDRSDIVAGFQQMGGEAVSKRVARSPLRDLSPDDGGLEGSLEDGLVEVVPEASTLSVRVRSARREEPFPVDLSAGLRLFEVEGSGDVDSNFRGLIASVESPDGVELGGNSIPQRARQQDRTVSPTFCISQIELVSAKIHVLDAQLRTLPQTKPRSVQDGGHQLRHTLELLQNDLRFVPTEHDGKPALSLGAFDFIHPRQV